MTCVLINYIILSENRGNVPTNGIRLRNFYGINCSRFRVIHMNQRFLEFDAAKLPLQKLNRMPLMYLLALRGRINDKFSTFKLSIYGLLYVFITAK